MFRLLKWLLILAVIAVLFLLFTGYQYKGQTLKGHLKTFFSSKLYQEGLKDIRVLTGESLRALGDVVAGDVTDEERKQLDKLIKDELKKDAGSKAEKAEAIQKYLPPEKNKK